MSISVKICPEGIRKEFPASTSIYKKKPIIYFDNACMTLKPQPVIDAIKEYYTEFPGCHGRTNHLFGILTTKKYEEARERIHKYFNTRYSEEIIFTRNSTEGLNLLANTIEFKADDIVLSSDIEHNSNLLPWQMAEKKIGIKRIIVPTNEDTSFNVGKLKEMMNSKVRLISILLTSNLTGVTFPISDIVKIAHDHNALICLDAAQSALYHPIDVQELDIDFMVTSLHKMWGPTGIGILYGKKKWLDRLSPFIIGGETVDDTTYTSAEMSEIPSKFEAGLQNYAGVIGSGAAIDYIEKVGQGNIYAHINSLNEYASTRLSEIEGIQILGPQDPKLRSGIINLLLNGISARDAATILNESENIMTRFGKHCVHSWFNKRRIPESLRISFSAYNTFEEIDVLIKSLKSIQRYFGN